jgi:hypothetical protein
MMRVLRFRLMVDARWQTPEFVQLAIDLHLHLVSVAWRQVAKVIANVQIV